LKINPVGYLPIIQFFLIAFINLIIFSWYERESDSNDKQNSIATKLNEQTLRFILLVLFFGSFTISGSLLLTTKLYFASVVLLMMTVIHLLIFWRKSWFEQDNLYRLVGDAAFLFPLLYILL
jgi:intracellular septation protein A